MPQIPMPLSIEALRILRCDRNTYFQLIEGMHDPDKIYVENVTHRLVEIEWIINKLQEEVNVHQPPIAQEGILSLQMYLILTCADTLGHIYHNRYVGKRIEEYFLHLPNDAKTILIDNFIIWKTTFTELVRLGIGNPGTYTITPPTRDVILAAVEAKPIENRFSAIIEFLSCRRNLYTHEAEYLQIGQHPILSVLQNIDANYPNVASLGDMDRIQFIFQEEQANQEINILIAYYRTNNVIDALYKAVLIGFGQIIGSL